MDQPGDLSVSATKIPVSRFTAVEPEAAAANRASAEQENELIIQPSKGWIGVDYRELWRNRELLYFLIWRDIKVRYKQAILGVGWAILQPAVQMLVFTLIFGVAARFKANLPVPYSVFVLCGLLPWQLFATSLTLGGMSLVNQQNLLTKIYFPRLFIPTAVVGGALVDMGVAALLFAALLLFNGIAPTAGILALPLLLLVSIVMSLGMAYLLSALTVTYRDFRFVVPFLNQIWMWLSFVAFPPSIIERFRWRWLFAFNPMYSIVAAYRKALLGHKLTDAQIGWDWRYMLVSSLLATGLFILGLFYFRRTERRFADIA